MTAAALPAVLGRVLADGLPSRDAGGGCLRVRRAWPADLDAPDAGYVLECEAEAGADQVVAAVADARGVRLLAGQEDARDLPALARWQARDGARLLAHRAGKRAVLVLPDGSFVKLARASAAQRSLARAATVEALLGDHAPRRPRLLASDTAAGWWRLAAAPGAALDGLLTAAPSDPGRVARAARSTAHALLALARVRPAEHPAHHLPGHTASDEAAVLSRWVHAAALGAPDGALPVPQARRLRERGAWLAARVAELDTGGSGGWGDAEPVLAHRDLHPGQVLVDEAAAAAGARAAAGESAAGPGCPLSGTEPATAQARGPITTSVTFLDWDTAAWAHPALDVANLLAHIDRAYAVTRAPAYRLFERELVAELTAHRHPATTPEGTGTSAVLRDAARLRIFAVHAFRPGPRDAAALTPSAGVPSS